MSLKPNNYKVWNFYKWILFIIILDSLKVWFFWDVSGFMIPILFGLISITIILLRPDLFSFQKKSVLIIILLYLLAIFLGTRGILNAYLGSFINSFGFLFFIGLKDHYKKDFLEFFVRYFTILIFISLLGWFLYLIGFNLPNFEDYYGFSERRNEAQYIFDNYYVFLLGKSKFTDIIFPRFSSVFLEPGYLGIVLVIILYLNHFNLKRKQNIILLTALFFTFSLAGWIMGIIAYIGYKLNNSRNKFIIFISISVFISIFFMFFSSYNNGDNIVNDYIISRLEFDDSKGTIAGYNRTSEYFDIWFNKFIISKDIFFGVDLYKIFGESAAVGWKVYMANYGLVGFLSYILFLFYIFYRYRNFDSFVFFALYLLIFIRGHHVIYWSAFPILYLSGSIMLSEIKQIKR